MELEKKLCVAQKEVQFAVAELSANKAITSAQLELQKEKSFNAVKQLLDRVYTYSARGLLGTISTLQIHACIIDRYIFVLYRILS